MIAGTAGSGARIAVITGASGLFGRALCPHLAARGWEVRALVRNPEVFRKSVPGVPVGRCVLPGTVDETLLEGATVLVHCAYATRVTDLVEARRVNEDGTRRMLDASSRAGLRFVFVSTVAAHPTAPNYYARSKHMLEQLLAPNRDLVFRPGLILAREGHGLFQQIQDNIRRLHVVPVFGRGRQPLQTVYIDDACEALGRALDRKITGSLNIAEPDGVALVDFLRMIAGRLGVRCFFPHLPFGPVLAVLRIIEALGLPAPLKSESLLGIKALRRVPVVGDLGRLGLRVRTAAESLDEILGLGPAQE